MNNLVIGLLFSMTTFGCTENTLETAAPPVAINKDHSNSLNGLSDSISLKFLALGDSYTIGQSVAEDQRWPNQLALHLDSLFEQLRIEETRIIARTGWTTQELNASLDNESIEANYNLVSLLIGVNNQYRGYPLNEYPAEFEKLLDRAINYAAGKEENVIVLSIPDYGFTPFGEPNQVNISKEIDAYNEINKEISLSKGVKYYDITAISRNGLDITNLVATDKLHPSGEQYRLWVKEILKDEKFLELIKHLD